MAGLSLSTGSYSSWREMASSLRSIRFLGAERLKPRGQSTCQMCAWYLLRASLLGTFMHLICPCCTSMMRNSISPYFTATIFQGLWNRLFPKMRIGPCTQPTHSRFCSRRVVVVPSSHYSST
uniref:Uncharacterized protein n=1 Tax=Opuntia streptacantha TaxID=393608 RepID=A0A7C9DD28_OPUST